MEAVKGGDRCHHQEASMTAPNKERKAAHIITIEIYYYSGDNRIIIIIISACRSASSASASTSLALRACILSFSHILSLSLSIEYRKAYRPCVHVYILSLSPHLSPSLSPSLVLSLSLSHDAIYTLHMSI
jgi:hypothetical protein